MKKLAKKVTAVAMAVVMSASGLALSIGAESDCTHGNTYNRTLDVRQSGYTHNVTISGATAVCHVSQTYTTIASYCGLCNAQLSCTTVITNTTHSIQH
ncbi:MAG: hypothetical protein ACI4KR_07955 [Ruminiclostridium sp.]